MSTEIDIQSAARLLADEGATFVDIRDPGSFAAGHIPGAVHATPDNLRELVENTDQSKEIVVYCYHGNSSRPASQWFRDQGFANARSMTGGYASWSMAAMNDPAFAVTTD